MKLTCPRCDLTVEQEFYGPCAACRADLRARIHRICQLTDEEGEDWPWDQLKRGQS